MASLPSSKAVCVSFDDAMARGFTISGLAGFVLMKKRGNMQSLTGNNKVVSYKFHKIDFLTFSFLLSSDFISESGSPTRILSMSN